jgi:dihydroneopterin aldolase
MSPNCIARSRWSSTCTPASLGRGVCSTDHIADTIDYSLVRERLRKLLREHRFQLLEAFAEAIASVLLCEFGAHWVRVRVVKPNKFDDVAFVGVLIERSVPPGDRQTPARTEAAVLQLIGAGAAQDADRSPARFASRRLPPQLGAG